MSEVEKALKYRVTGPIKNGAVPCTMYVLVDRSRQVKVVWSDGTFQRFLCWACAMKTRQFELADQAPQRVLVPRGF